jgi:hypothetical protein
MGFTAPPMMKDVDDGASCGRRVLHLCAALPGEKSSSKLQKK